MERGVERKRLKTMDSMKHCSDRHTLGTDSSAQGPLLSTAMPLLLSGMNSTHHKSIDLNFYRDNEFSIRGGANRPGCHEYVHMYRSLGILPRPPSVPSYPSSSVSASNAPTYSASVPRTTQQGSLPGASKSDALSNCAIDDFLLALVCRS